MSAEELLALIRGAPSPTPEQLEEQRFDFAYGNLAASTNHKPSRAAFESMAKDRGWAASSSTNGLKKGVASVSIKGI